MPQRLNYTGRQKILKQDVSIRVREQLDGLSFDADLRLAEYKLDPQARVYVEAYRSASTAWDRWDFGRVGLLSPPEQRRLDKFGGADGVLFRVKVSATDQAIGKLLAEADAIRPLLPDDPGHGDPLIKPEPGPIGSEPWLVRFDDDMPVLVINEKLPGWKSLVMDPLFRSLVAPAVMRQILNRILIIDRNTGDDENPADWRGRWIRYAQSLPGVAGEIQPMEPDQSNATDVEWWIDTAVSSFAARSGLFDRLVEHRKQEGGQ
jgi:hypothetical protein